MKCWPLDLRHLQRDSDFSAGFGRNGDPAYTLTSAQTGGGNIPAVAFAQNQRNEVRQMDVVGALAAEPGMKQTAYIAQGGAWKSRSTL